MDGVLPRTVTAIAIDPINTNTVYIATTRGTLKSTDGGTRWRPFTIDPKHRYYSRIVSALAVDPHHPATVYAGTDVRLGRQAGQSGVFKSTDGGRTWRPFNLGLGGRYRQIRTLVVNPRGGVYAGTSAGFFTTA